jgi:hypothetical protein
MLTKELLEIKRLGDLEIGEMAEIQSLVIGYLLIAHY